MPETLTIHLARPIAAVCMAEGPGPSTHPTTGEPEIHNPQSTLRRSEGRSRELDQLCALVTSLADKLNRLYEETIANHRSEIARLAVEISRRILAQRVANSDYDILAVVEEALKRAPTRQNVVVQVNPQDLPACQRLQQDDADGPLAQLEFVAEESIARADCLVETPKGIVQSFVEQHLERISEALMKVK
jgi:flagellar biosynthesis/type III secretory pathway protein FliH